jgi:hypothetical protein
MTDKGCDAVRIAFGSEVPQVTCVWDSKRTPPLAFNTLEELWHMKHRWGVQEQARASPLGMYQAKYATSWWFHRFEQRAWFQLNLGGSAEVGSAV